MIDLLQAAQDAVYDALAGSVPAELATVRQHVRENTQPPLVIIGALDSVPESKGGELELVTVEIQSIYRGGDRGELLRIAGAVRAALDGCSITADGASFSTPSWTRTSVSDAASDGVTYAAISTFEFYAEPA